MLNFLRYLYKQRNDFQRGYSYMKRLIKVGNKLSINFAFTACQMQDSEYDRGVMQAYDDYYSRRGFRY